MNKQEAKQQAREHYRSTGQPTQVYREAGGKKWKARPGWRAAIKARRLGIDKARRV